MYEDAIKLIKAHLNNLEELHKEVNPSDMFIEGMYYGGEGELANVIDMLEKAQEKSVNDMSREL